MLTPEKRAAEIKGPGCCAHCQISSTLVRLATRLGINRHAKVVAPLKDYLSARAEVIPSATAVEALP